MSELVEIRKERFGGRVGSAKMSADMAVARLKRAGRGDGSNPVLSRARRVVDTKDEGGVVRKGFVTIPANHVARGGAAGRKQLKGAAQEAAQSQWKKQLVGVGKADCDQNSLRSPVKTTMVMPDSKHKAAVTRAQGQFIGGRSNGVGRHLTRDENSSPGATKVRTPTLREINGKFAGQGEGVKVFHPIGQKGGRRGSVHTKGIFHTTGEHGSAVGHSVKKGLATPGVTRFSAPASAMQQKTQQLTANSLRTRAGNAFKTGERLGQKANPFAVRKGMLEPVELINMHHHTGARVGRRIPVEVEKGILGAQARNYKTAIGAIYGSAGKGQRGKALAAYGRGAAPVGFGALAAAPKVGNAAGKVATRFGANPKQAEGAKFAGELGTKLLGGQGAIASGARSLRRAGF